MPSPKSQSVHVSPLEEDEELAAERVDEPDEEADGMSSLTTRVTLADEIARIRERVSREGEREVERRTREVIVDLLDVVDDLDRAVESATDGADPALLDGVSLVRDRFLDKLAARGVERMESDGERFDPEAHEALTTASVPSPRDDGRIVAVVRPGYRIHGELLRPARVVVGRHG